MDNREDGWMNSFTALFTVFYSLKSKEESYIEKLQCALEPHLHDIIFQWDPKPDR